MRLRAPGNLPEWKAGKRWRKQFLVRRKIIPHLQQPLPVKRRVGLTSAILQWIQAPSARADAGQFRPPKIILIRECNPKPPVRRRMIFCVRGLYLEHAIKSRYVNSQIVLWHFSPLENAVTSSRQRRGGFLRPYRAHSDQLIPKPGALPRASMHRRFQRRERITCETSGDSHWKCFRFQLIKVPGRGLLVGRPASDSP